MENNTSEQWKSDGHCNMCRRHGYCDKEMKHGCSARKRKILEAEEALKKLAKTPEGAKAVQEFMDNAVQKYSEQLEEKELQRAAD